ncbi:hypothetical protein GCM10027037_16440 [Mucilaginibacter koreensis]
MKKTLLLLGWLCIGLQAFCQTEPVNYRTAVNRFIHFYNQNQPDSLYTLFSPTVTGKMTAAQNRASITQLQASLGLLNKATFVRIDSGVASYNTDFAKASATMRIQLNKSNQFEGLLFSNYQAKETAVSAGNPYVSESPFTYKGLNATINGTLTLPKNASGKIPVVLIIAGSGPTDRNGNSSAGLNTNTYKLLAYELGKNGIAALRYDKRIIGQAVTPASEKVLRFDNFVDDAVGLITQLHDDPRFSKVIVFGHSEGSLVGMLSVVDEPAAGFISAAGAGVMADKVVTEQLKSQPDFIKNNFKAVLDTMRRGKINENVDPALYSVIRPSVQPYLMSWFRFDPAKEIKKVKVPVLIIQGNNDVQVSVDNAEKLKKAKSEAQLVIIPGMNHILKQAPLPRDQNLLTYTNPDLPIDPTLVSAVVGFVNKLN